MRGAGEMDGKDTFTHTLWSLEVLAFRKSFNIYLRATIARVIPRRLIMFNYNLEVRVREGGSKA